MDLALVTVQTKSCQCYFCALNVPNPSCALMPFPEQKQNCHAVICIKLSNLNAHLKENLTKSNRK